MYETNKAIITKMKVKRKEITLKENQDTIVPGSGTASFIKYSILVNKLIYFTNQEKKIASVKLRKMKNKYKIRLCFFTKYFR